MQKRLSSGNFTNFATNAMKCYRKIREFWSNICDLRFSRIKLSKLPKIIWIVQKKILKLV